MLNNLLIFYQAQVSKHDNEGW